MFKAIVIDKNEEKGYHSALIEVDEAQLPEGDVLVEVIYSTLNYKDGLAITGKGPVVRKFPMVPGVDLVGRVIKSESDRFATDDLVLLNGWGVGEVHWGGLAEKARLNSDWLIAMPEGLTPAQVMAAGTAGYTAMLCVQAIEDKGVKPGDGEVLVTGANGGVGGYSVKLLSRLGYHVVASTGRPEEADYLKALGASDIIDRQQLSEPGKPLQKERWAAVIDSVGSHTLANACAQTRYGGVVAACGLAQGMDFPATVAPFILRGVTLAGIDSVMRPLVDRERAWKRLAELLEAADFDVLSHEIRLDDVVQTAAELIDGKVRGRVLVKIQD
ncbi:MDR family oxidoreductase [Nitrincola schmidtii]|uniref:acrylyl-CoA reductase (NADPH) n=1 Tax=Nitrincola schmidtii TaxID=1730894 RepID=UPI00124C87A7|nr:MDR family oxidoreductase [Nitrincola schmidtii]